MMTEDRFKEGYKEILNALESLQKARNLFADKGGILADLYLIHKLVEDTSGYRLQIEKFFVDFYLKKSN